MNSKVNEETKRRRSQTSDLEKRGPEGGVVIDEAANCTRMWRPVLFILSFLEKGKEQRQEVDELDIGAVRKSGWCRQRE